MTDVPEPVTDLAEESVSGPRPGIGVAVSGGGYRAMLFHLGAFLRLFELGTLKQCARISSVSGGSITCAKIALEWRHLATRDDFLARVVDPIRAMAEITIDVSAVLEGLILPGGVSRRVSRAYRKHLFGDATLQDLPDDIRFVINATNLETGKLWRFSKPYMADYTLGMVDNPKTLLADAVTASSAFPPVLSPFELDVSEKDFSQKVPGLDPRLFNDIKLTDGGVYDNLGLETVWKNYQTVLVSDAGVALAPDPDPPSDWARLGLRVVDVIFGQIASVRTREVIASYKAKERTGGYWGIRTDIGNYQLPDALPCPIERTTELAATPTRLAALEPAYQERLINWGYAVCDAAMRKYYLPKDTPPKTAFPYPGGV
ncbi:MAG TPA: patatin-like phospholipase family protein [Allosphingosinicella sp.]